MLTIDPPALFVPAIRAGILNGFDNLNITGTPAKIAGYCPADFLFIGMRIFFQQRMSAHQHTGSAKTAVRGVMIEEGFLQRIETPVFAQTFNGQYFLPVHLRSKNKAGIDRIAVQQNGAAAAFPDFTAPLGAGQTEIFPQHIKHGAVCLNSQRVGTIVYCSFDGNVLH
jgi:hypothetical protein